MRIQFIVFLFLSFFVTGCAQNISSDQYSANEIGSAQQVLKGRITSLKPVSVDRSSGVGTLAGAVAGGAAGSLIGNNTATNVIGAVGGAVVGGAVGSFTEKKLSEAQAIEYVIRLQNKSYVSIIQATPPIFQKGQHVLVFLGPRAHLTLDPDYTT